MKRLFLLAIFGAFAISPIIALAQPTVTFAAPPTEAEQRVIDEKCEKRILGFPTWYRGLSAIDAKGECTVISPDQLNTSISSEPSNGLQNFIWKVVLNVIEIGLFIAGYVALFFVLYGGFQFLTGGSNPGQVEKARTTILNAVIGLAISMAAIAAVNLIFRLLAA